MTSFLDDAVAGFEHIHRALELAVACGDAEEQMRSHWNRGVCVSESGDRAASVEYYRVAIEALPRLGQSHLLPELYAVMGDSGERDVAAEHLVATHRAAVGMGATPLRQLIERFAGRARLDLGTARRPDRAFGAHPTRT